MGRRVTITRACIKRWRAELGDEWLMGKVVKPAEEYPIKIPP